MHMVAANLCVWIATTVKETHQEFVVFGYQHPSTTAHSPSATAATYHSHEDHDSDDWKSSSELLTNITDGEFIAASVSVQTLYGQCPKAVCISVSLTVCHTRIGYFILSKW